MQAIEITFPGDFWDSAIYDGHLYLFTRDGAMEVYDWDRLVAGMSWTEDLRPLAQQVLTRGKDWYAPELQRLLESPAIGSQISSLLAKASATKIDVSKEVLARAHLSTLDAPGFPHSDLDAYYNRLYVGGPSGISVTDLRDAEEAVILTDVPALRVAAGQGAIAVAAGSEGLFEVDVAESQRRLFSADDDAHQLSEVHSQSCSWARFDIVANTGDPGTSGYVAAFSKSGSKAARRAASDTEDQRHLIGIVEAPELFGNSNGLMFGDSNRVVLVRPGSVEIRGWNPYKRRKDFGVDLHQSMSILPAFASDRLKEHPVDAALAVFGAVVEYPDHLLVLASDGTARRLREPINWRVYPRSQRYINHLHVTYETRLIVRCYFHDYFTPSKDRTIGAARPRSLPRFG